MLLADLKLTVFKIRGTADLKTIQRMSNMVTCPMADCHYNHEHHISEDGLPWTCFGCGASACASCHSPWHDGETCEQYMTRTALNIAETHFVENRSERPIVGCPSCQAKIQKTEGCDHMECRCGAEFCYGCQAYYLSARTEGWQGFLAVQHETTCSHYTKTSKGHVIEGLSWEEFLQAKQDVEFGSKHYGLIVTYKEDDNRVSASYRASGSDRAQ